MDLSTRIYLSVIGKPFFRRLILPIGLILLIVSSLDPMTDWAMLKARLAALDPWKISAIFTTLILLWGIAVGRALRPVWRQPAVSFLVRQPISHWRWVWHLLPSLWIAFLPIASVWWLAPHYAHPVVHYAGFVGLSWSVFLGASFRGFAAAKFVAIGTVANALLIFAYCYLAETAYLAILVTIFLLPMSISGIRDQLTLSGEIRPSHLVSQSPVLALVRRDLLCLWRLERKSLSGLIAPAVLAALMMLALRVNSQVSGREAFLFACGMLAFAVMPTYDVLVRLKTRLGTELMRQRWPIRHSERGISLLAVMCVLTVPVAVILGGLGSTMGLAYGFLFLLFVANTIVALTALFSGTLVLATPMVGWGLWLLFIHTILAITLPPWVYGLGAAIMVPVGLLIIVKGLQTFTHQTELGKIDQFA